MRAGITPRAVWRAAAHRALFFRKEGSSFLKERSKELLIYGVLIAGAAKAGLAPR
jgi:hypothetical protein